MFEVHHGLGMTVDIIVQTVAVRRVGGFDEAALEIEFVESGPSVDLDVEMGVAPLFPLGYGGASGVGEGNADVGGGPVGCVVEFEPHVVVGWDSPTWVAKEEDYLVHLVAPV